MPVFRYKATTTAGELLEGEMQASDQAAVIQRLQLQGHIPIRADEVAERTTSGFGKLSRYRWRSVSRKDIGLITLELATLLQAGLALDKALGILADLTEHPQVQRMLARIREEVRGGASLSNALEIQGPMFSQFYLNLVRAGEASGALDVTLARLAEFMERSRTLREALASALIYPAILVFLAVISVMVLVSFVIPQFSEMFAEAGQTLPWPTQVVVAVGTLFERYGWILVLITLGVFYYLRRQYRNPTGRLRWDTRLLKLPLIGDLIAKLEAARFTRTLGTLLSNGVPVLNAVGIAKEVIGNQMIAQGVARVAVRISEGQGLASPLAEARVFPRLTSHLLQVGEETGSLEDMLLRVADIYEREVQTAIQRLVTLVEPVVILGLGLLIAGIILSVLMAILSVNELGF